MSDQQRAALDTAIRSSGIDFTGVLERLRARFAAFRAGRPPVGGVTATPGELGGVPVVDVVVDEVGASDAVILYLHGGGFVVGIAADSVGIAADMAGRAGVRAVSVDYRLAPEHPYPAALDDVLACYNGLIDSGVPAARIALVGQSSGGGLVIATLNALRDAGVPLPACAVVFSPWVDLTLSGESMSAKAAVDPSLSRAGVSLRAADYAGSRDVADPAISPLFADLTGLPPLLIQAGSHEVLLDDATRLAARAAAADIDVHLEVTAGVPHVFQTYTAVLDEAQTAVASAVAFIRRAFEQPPA